MVRPVSSQQQVAETRNAILDAAQRLHEAHGLGGTSYRAIAADLGCSHSMPYAYFPSKANLVDNLRLRAYEWMHGELTIAASSCQRPLDALRELATAYVSAGLRRPRMYELLYTDQGEIPEDDPVLVAAKLAAIGVCQDVIEAGVASGAATLTVDAQTAAHLFWVAAHGLVSLEHGGFLVVGRAIDQILPALFRSVVRGVIESEGT